MPRRTREDGVSVVELALVLPILLLLLATVAPVVKAGFEYMSLTRATAHGIRYATKVEVNARCDGTVDEWGRCDGELRRRPTTDEVEAFVRDAAWPLQESEVVVTPEPAGSMAGELVTVTATHEVSFGPLGGVANVISQVFFGGSALLPESGTMTARAYGRQE